jgi:hypothetical protein
VREADHAASNRGTFAVRITADLKADPPGNAVSIRINQPDAPVAASMIAVSVPGGPASYSGQRCRRSGEPTGCAPGALAVDVLR